MGKFILLAFCSVCLAQTPLPSPNAGSVTGGTGGTPGGSTNDIQWNSASTFAGGRCTMTSTGGGTIICTGNVTAAGISTGSSPPTVTGNGVMGMSESTGQTCAASGVDCLIADSTAHAIKISNNNGTAYPLTKTIASGAKALATGAISSAACTSAQTDTATGTLTTDTVQATFNGDPTAVTGFVPLTSGMLTIIVYPTADAVDFKVCNNTSGSITPGAITLNWRVTR